MKKSQIMRVSGNSLASLWQRPSWDAFYLQHGTKTLVVYKSWEIELIDTRAKRGAPGEGIIGTEVNILAEGRCRDFGEIEELCRMNDFTISLWGKNWRPYE